MPSDAKRALIVGGSCAIGQSIALLLAQDGFQVIVTYHSSQQSVLALAEQNALISSKQLDLTAPKDVLEAFAAQVVAEGGGKSPEVTVFCAAAIKPVVFGEIDAGAFDMHYHSIVRGPLWLIQALAPTLPPASRILLFSSALARTSTVFDDRYAVYASAKAASEQLVKYLSRTLASHGATINAIAPGPIDTPGLRKNSTPVAGSAADAGDANVARLSAMAPAKRIGRPDEVAHAVRFLTSSESSWVSGAILNVSGGMCVYG